MLIVFCYSSIVHSVSGSAVQSFIETNDGLFSTSFCNFLLVSDD